MMLRSFFNHQSLFLQWSIACMVWLGIDAHPPVNKVKKEGDMFSCILTDLKVDHLSYTEILHHKNPVLSWKIELRPNKANGSSTIGSTVHTHSPAFNLVQESYQILAATRPELLKEGAADLWNSGRIVTAASNNIRYQGVVPKPTQKVYWKVKVWMHGQKNPIEEQSSWRMGLYHYNDWKGRWIGLNEVFPWESADTSSNLSARYFRKTFSCNKPIREAIYYTAAGGLQINYLNGVKLGDAAFAPHPTDFSKDILYQGFDVTKLIQLGENVLGSVLGSGRFFAMRQHTKPFKNKSFGLPRFLSQLKIEYADGTIAWVISDDSWMATASGPVRAQNEYDGEFYDAEFDLGNWTLSSWKDSSSSRWKPADLMQDPGGERRPMLSPAMKVMQTLKAVSVKKQEGSPEKHPSFIFDFGQNLSGRIRMKYKAAFPAKTRIQFRYAESLQENGGLFLANLRDAKNTDHYWSGKEGLVDWAPSFVYHGFRFVEVVGLPEYLIQDPAFSLEAEMIYDGLAQVGSMVSGHPLLNQIHKNAFWGIASNYKGIPVDCPQRNERQPWLGDRNEISRGEAFLFQNHLFYRKWLRDILSAQKEDGAIPDVAPAFWHYYSDNMTWPGTFLQVVDLLEKHFGDQQVVLEYYPAMNKWMRYMADRYLTANGVLNKDSYGDWCAPPADMEAARGKSADKKYPSTFIATAYFSHYAHQMEGYAKRWGKQEDIDFYRKAADKSKKASAAMLKLSEASLTDLLLAWQFNLVTAAQREQLKLAIEQNIVVKNKGHLSTGLIGTQWLMRTLQEMGRQDLAFQLATNTSYPSWGYMLEEGATTIWELWNGNTAHPRMNSQNHVMLLGDLLTWMYERTGGIRLENHAASHLIRLQPTPVVQMKQMEVKTETAFGPIRSAWQIGEPLHFTWKIDVPVNCVAQIKIPLAVLKGGHTGPLSNSNWEKYKSLSPIAFSEKVMLLQVNGQSLSKWVQTESTKLLAQSTLLKRAGVSALPSLQQDGFYLVLGSGSYEFKSELLDESTLTKETSASKNKVPSGPVVLRNFLYEEAKFPSCHSGTLEETPTGLVAAFFGGTRERHPDVEIYFCRQTDRGWTSPVSIANGIQTDGTRLPTWNPVLYQVKNGPLLLFYKIGPKPSEWWGMVKESTDGGLNWSTPKRLPDGLIGPVKNKPVLLSNGILLAPSSTEGKGWKLHMERSKDQGITWEKQAPIPGGLVYEPQQGVVRWIAPSDTAGKKNVSSIDAIQPSVLFHGGDTLQVIARSRNRALMQSWSYDLGKTWQPLKPLSLPSNNSGTDAVTLSDGRQALVYNHVLPPGREAKGLRTPLNLALSKDGINWSAVLILEDSPISQYSYPCIIQGKDGMIHILYTWRRQKMQYVKIDPNLLPELK